MTHLRRAALLAGVMAILFIALEFALHIRTAMAGVFVAGVAGGLLLADSHRRQEGPRP